MPWEARNAAIALAVLLATPIVVLGQPPAAEERDCDRHPPITIVGDHGPAGFTLADPELTGEPLHRPGSGVRAGSGSSEDPYRIEGWCLASPGEGDPAATVDHAIRLQDTRAHVVIEANLVDGGDGPVGFERGIVLDGAENVTVRGNDVEATAQSGVHVDESRGASLEANTVRDAGAAIRVEDTRDAHVHANALRANDRALELVGGEGVLVEANTVTDNDRALHASEAIGLQVRGNALLDNDEGLQLSATEGASLQANRVVGHDGPGLELDGGGDARVQANAFTANGEAVRAERLDGLAFANNELTGNGKGLVLRFAADGSVVDNAFEDHGTAVFLEGTNRTTVAGNRLADHHGGLVVWEARDTDVEANRFTAGTNAISVGRSNQTQIANNTVRDHTNIALALQDSGQTRVEDNLLRGNGDGVAVHAGADHVLRGNVVEADDRAGLFASDLEAPVDAVQNWWGHASGPSGGAVDACTGALAEGEGERIDLEAAEVCFDPPLSEPNTQAGAP